MHSQKVGYSKQTEVKIQGQMHIMRACSPTVREISDDFFFLKINAGHYVYNFLAYYNLAQVQYYNN